MAREEIEKLRNKIDTMISFENITSDNLLEVSQEMDTLILEYLKDKIKLNKEIFGN